MGGRHRPWTRQQSVTRATGAPMHADIQGEINLTNLTVGETPSNLKVCRSLDVDASYSESNNKNTKKFHIFGVIGSIYGYFKKIAFQNKKKKNSLKEKNNTYECPYCV